MKPTQLMIRYGELSTKGKNIYFFIDKLGNNVILLQEIFKEYVRC